MKSSKGRKVRPKTRPRFEKFLGEKGGRQKARVGMGAGL